MLRNMLRSTLRLRFTTNGRQRSSSPCTPVGFVTLVAITAVAIAAVVIAAVAVPSVVIIRIAAVVASVVAVLGIAFVHNVLVVIAMIAFFRRAIDKIVENLITIVVNLVLR
jgi:hypothetical protein